MNDFSRLLPPRDRNAYKHLFGHVLVLGGDLGMPGAVRLAAEGALRVGAGCVTVGTRSEHLGIVLSGRPELMCYALEGAFDEQLSALMERATVVILGPGLGQSTWSLKLFEQTIKTALPLILDADGLNHLAKNPKQRSQWILTPHPGEAARLLGQSSLWIQENRMSAVDALLHAWGGVIVLKGMHTLIASQDEATTCCTAGNPGMASPGMGDVLTGVIAGLLAQGLTLRQAAEWGVWIHAIAGDRVAAHQGERGLLASDLFLELAALVNRFTFC